MSAEARQLANLQMHWGSAYDIALCGSTWAATFRGTSHELTAGSARELREMIRADYWERTRPRHLHPVT